MQLYQVIVLALIQALTEFLPISRLRAPRAGALVVRLGGSHARPPSQFMRWELDTPANCTRGILSYRLVATPESDIH